MADPDDNPFGMFRTAALLLACLLVVANHSVTAARPDARIALEVTTRARVLRPGEVILLAVSTSERVQRPEGDGFGVALHFWPAGAGKWQALVGVPLETRAGAHNILLRAADDTGATVSRTVTLHTEPARFETRRLTVEERYSDPPAPVIERIVREARLLEQLFAGSDPERLWRGAFTLPVAGPSTSSFGRLTLLNGKPGSRHQGADFRAAVGTPVKAPNRGVVVLASDLYYAGQTVVIDHGQGLVSLFAHLSRIEVDAGARVEHGDRLGLTGATGRVTGPHLHWAMRLHGTSVDPLSLAAAVAELMD